MIISTSPGLFRGNFQTCLQCSKIWLRTRNWPPRVLRRQKPASSTTPRSESNGARPGPGFGPKSIKNKSMWFCFPEQSWVHWFTFWGDSWPLGPQPWAWVGAVDPAIVPPRGSWGALWGSQLEPPYEIKVSIFVAHLLHIIVVCWGRPNSMFGSFLYVLIMREFGMGPYGPHGPTWAKSAAGQPAECRRRPARGRRARAAKPCRGKKALNLGGPKAFVLVLYRLYQ